MQKVFGDAGLSNVWCIRPLVGWDSLHAGRAAATFSGLYVRVELCVVVQVCGPCPSWGQVRMEEC